MDISDLTEKDIKFLIELLEKKRLTKKEQTAYVSPLAYYLGTWALRDAGLIRTDGLDQRRRNIWVLTEKGEKIAKLLKQLRDEMEAI